MFDDGTEETYTVGTFYAATDGQIGDRVTQHDVGWGTAIIINVAATYGPLSAKEW